MFSEFSLWQFWAVFTAPSSKTFSLGLANVAIVVFPPFLMALQAQTMAALSWKSFHSEPFLDLLKRFPSTQPNFHFLGECYLENNLKSPTADLFWNCQTVNHSGAHTSFWRTKHWFSYFPSSLTFQTYQLFLTKLMSFSSATTVRVNSGQRFSLEPISPMPRAVVPVKRQLGDLLK